MAKPKLPNGSSEDDLVKVDTKIFIYLVVMILVFLVALIIWFLSVSIGLNLGRNNIGDLGTVGDYFGGLLNPFFAFMAFLLLTQSIRLQLKEMADTRVALQQTSAETKRAAEAQEQSVRAQRSLAELQRENHEIQNNILVLQKERLDFDREIQKIKIFERSFYNLIEDLKIVNEDKKFNFDIPYSESVDEYGEYVEAGSTKHAMGFEQSIAYLLDSFTKDGSFDSMIFTFDHEGRMSFGNYFHKICCNKNSDFYVVMGSVVHKVYQIIVMINESEFLSVELKDWYISVLKRSLKSDYKSWIFLHSIGQLDFNLSLYDKYKIFIKIQVTPTAYDLFIKFYGFYKNPAPE